MSNRKDNKNFFEEIRQHQTDLKTYLNLDVESESQTEQVIHMNHRFFKTFFPNEEDNFNDFLPFEDYSKFECWELLGKILVEL